MNDDDIEDFIMNACVAATPLSIRVYHGSELNKQYAAFIKAVSNVSRLLGTNRICVEFLSLTDIRKHDSLCLDDFVAWLLDSDMHFIICYLHQGVYIILYIYVNATSYFKIFLQILMHVALLVHCYFDCTGTRGMGWSMNSIRTALQKLKNHKATTTQSILYLNNNQQHKVFCISTTTNNSACPSCLHYPEMQSGHNNNTIVHCYGHFVTAISSACRVLVVTV
jgi:hypothetical protein